MKLVFFLSLFFSAYSYFIYPALLALVPARRRLLDLAIAANPSLPKMSLIITAHNEAKRIGAKLDNALAAQYARDQLEIIVASDASTDQTDNIVQSYASNGVKLVRPPERRGKEYAQWCAIQQAQGDILVFSDVATELPPDALQKMAQAFESAPSVGAVSSEDRFVSLDGRIAGEGAYVRYEMWLRRLESERGGLVGLSGSFFAARRVICDSWDIYSPSDFNTALNCAHHGQVAISHPEVVGMYTDVKDPSQEYARKVRTILRGITALMRHPEVLSPRYGLFAFQVWGHKLLRWLVPWFLLLLLLSNLWLWREHRFFQLTLAGQIGFYGIALLAHWNTSLRDNLIARIIYFFVQVNVAIADATLKFLRGTRMTVWTPSAR